MGVVSAIGWSLGLRGLLQTPAVDATDAEIVTFYADDNAGRNAVLWLQVIVVATIAFMWFVGVVRSRVGDREPRLSARSSWAAPCCWRPPSSSAPLRSRLRRWSPVTELGGQVVDPGAAVDVPQLRRHHAVGLRTQVHRVLVMLSTASLGRATHACRRCG